MLQNLFDVQLRKVVVEKVAALVEDKIKAEGITLGKRDRRRLLKALEEGRLESMSFGRWRWWDNRTISLELTEGDLEAFEEEVQEFLDSLPEVVPEVVGAITPSIVEWIDSRGRKNLRRERRELLKFEKRLQAKWSEPFELLDLVIHLSTDVGTEVMDPALREESDAEQLASLIIRLHGRGLRIAREVLTLLRGGFAEAALARWRTLHEVTVVASFIADHGEPCAERYTAHYSVANYKGARRYQEDAPRLGYLEFTSDEMDRIKEARDQAIARYGADFGKDYGWATPFLGRAPANFAEIEKAVSFDHFRSLHKWASQEIHAGVKALYSDLAAPSADMILIGPTNTGFADPGQNTCISLMVLTAVVLQLGPTIDSLVTSNAMSHFVDRAIDQFVEVQKEVESTDG